MLLDMSRRHLVQGRRAERVLSRFHSSFELDNPAPYVRRGIGKSGGLRLVTIAVSIVETK